MKDSILNLGLVSTAVLLTLVPATRALPPLQPHHRKPDSQFAPRQYNVYEPLGDEYGGYYTYAGYGPQPTISQSSASSRATSKSSGEETSLSSVNHACESSDPPFSAASSSLKISFP
jgi:hypothetical protein